MTQTDATAVREMGSLRPSPATHPHLYSWAAMVTKFSEQVMVSWPAGDSNRVEEMQTAQIAALQVQVTRLDNASKN